MKKRLCVGIALALLSAEPMIGQARHEDTTESDIPAKFQSRPTEHDFAARELMIPMRDGVKLHTILYVPQGAHGLPMLLERTPYDASSFVGNSVHLRAAVWPAAREWIDDGYILVFQDVRGKYGSEGAYTMTRPPRGPLNSSVTDETTDAWDTIDWLVKNVPESNQRVGMIGSSYDGWTTAMALLDPHPNLKVAAPESPMVDGWIGDDWFHNGAFRQVNLNYFLVQTSAKDGGRHAKREAADDYQEFLEAGSAGRWAEHAGMQQLPFWQRLTSHPAYDGFWQAQALDKLLAVHPSSVPTLWLQGLWDQEDIYGAVHCWEALKNAGATANNHLVIGPWYHSQMNTSGQSLGPLKWPTDTTAAFRKEVLIPFFDAYLKDTPSKKPLPQAMIYNPAEKRWDDFEDWSPATSQHRTPLYLQAEGGLGFTSPKAGFDTYQSDPSKPVPFMDLPVRFDSSARWDTWLVADQRFASARPDVLVYKTAPLTEPLRVQGAPYADLFAKTTGTDGDFVMKLIDVYPEDDLDDMSMAGYQLAVSLEIFRGRYRESLEYPKKIEPGRVEEYKFRLPTIDYTFKPRHRIMVQIQSSLFPLYDRNPQSYVDNIFFAPSESYKKVDISIERGFAGESAVLLPLPDESDKTK